MYSLWSTYRTNCLCKLSARVWCWQICRQQPNHLASWRHVCRPQQSLVFVCGIRNAGNLEVQPQIASSDDVNCCWLIFLGACRARVWHHCLLDSLHRSPSLSVCKYSWMDRYVAHRYRVWKHALVTPRTTLFMCRKSSISIKRLAGWQYLCCACCVGCDH